MQLTILSPRKSLNKAYLKVKPSRSEIELFKENLIGLLDGLDESESEEHNKNDLGYFLNNTFYHPRFYINTKDRADLVIHNGSDSKSYASVLIEAKKPSNKTEMVQLDNLNAKAFHELILYYLRERITNHNLEIKHLIATNIYEWYVFDAGIFEKTFAQDKKLVQQFTDFEEGRLAGKSTDFFYKEIAEPFLTGLTAEFSFTWFDFRDYDKPLRNDDKKDDSKLIALYKLLSPEHLLKLPFANDSNSLDKAFYTELLHIIGLTETKEGSKKLIGRKKEGQRDPGSLIENAIIQIDSRDMISRIEKPSRFGETYQERLFNVSLELVITWINRILFLKLLEAQLISYHKGDSAYSFFNSEKVKGFDSIDSLFFRVLAKKTTERDPAVAKLFENVPYLNSSLFEPTELERETIFISNLQDECQIPIHSGTVLKDSTGKRLTEKLNGLDYLFAFLDAYDFSGEGAEEIQEENKTLINASVLGLIFEKINGYKDGSFFTPGYVTMYMCRETIRRAVVHKFNDLKGWNCQDLAGLYDKIEDKKEANEIINQLRICDPAVGSGHFLVSALNEIIFIKSELKILSDKEGKRLKEYHLEVVNDELIITDEDGDLFEYNPNSPESQRVQETLCHEKQTIIENCLFGVDINPKSVMICRLRLWIELLKNSYYTSVSNYKELDTLPNIDINIKCGNSLISRFDINDNYANFPTGTAQKIRLATQRYKDQVILYKITTDKSVRKLAEKNIAEIKRSFSQIAITTDTDYLKWKAKEAESIKKQTEIPLGNEEDRKIWAASVQNLSEECLILENNYEQKLNTIYSNTFEWRFEFPEILDENGKFIGFDVIIGNPPYISYYSGMAQEISKDIYQYYLNRYDFIENKKTRNRIGTVMLFLELSTNLLKSKGEFCNIIDLNIFSLTFLPIRRYLTNNVHINQIISDIAVFEDVGSGQAILSYKNIKEQNNSVRFQRGFGEEYIHYIGQNEINSSNNFSFFIDKEEALIKKIRTGCVDFEEAAHIISGMNIGGVKDYFLSEIKNDENYHKAILSGNIFKYKIDYPNEVQRKNPRNNYIKFDKEIEKFIWDNNIGTPSIGADDSKFRQEKLLLRRPLTSDGKLAAAFSSDYDDYSDVTVYIINKKELELKYLLAIINSTLATFYCQKIGIIRNQKGQQPQITINQFKKFPTKIIEKHQQQLFINIVDQILSTKKSNPTADTCALENEIDQLVYDLYGLTEEEIRIVEGS